MREKYVEERFHRYFVFGMHPDGKVDLAHADNSTIATVTPDEARALIAERNAAVDMLCKLASKLDEAAPDEFGKLWYGEKG